MLQIQKQFTAYNYSIRREPIKSIIIHDVGAVSSAKNNADYFKGGDRCSSADFFVDSNNIIQIIDYHKHYSWAIGDGHGKYGKTNSNSVSIEMCLEVDGQPSEATINNTLDLVRYLMSELNLSSDIVLRHFDCSGKKCPASFSANNWAKWWAFKDKLKAALTVDTKFGWYKVGNDWYYYNVSGMVKNGWAKDSKGKWFALGPNGKMVTNGWAQDSSKKWFYLGADGEMVVNQWAQDSKGWCYLGADGAWDGVYHTAKGGA